MATVTIPGVELARAGTWDAAVGGRVELTTERFDAMVEASRNPLVDHAAIKIGHSGAWAALGDSAPALGWVGNLRRDGDRLIGDLVDVPVRLAKVAAKAYRRRSIEAAFGYKLPDGTRLPAVLTGLALLGTQPPAVKGLADVLDLYDTEPARRIAAGGPTEVEQAVELVLAEGDPEPTALAALAATATLVATAVTSGSSTEEAANAILDTVYAAAGVPDATIRVPDAPARHASPDDPATGPGGRPMPMTEERLRELTGAAADADLDAVVRDLVTKATATPATQPPTPATTPAATTPATTPAATAPASTPASTATTPASSPAPEVLDTPEKIAAAAATNPAATVTLSAGVAAALLTDAQAGTVALAAMQEQERRSIIEQGIREGRITPAEAVANFAAATPAVGDQPAKPAGPWHSLATGDPATLRTFLSGLSPRYGAVELGAGDHIVDEAAASTAFDAFTEGLFGSELAELGR